jgi:AAA+ superfamily predicted ATPase
MTFMRKRGGVTRKIATGVISKSLISVTFLEKPDRTNCVAGPQTNLYFGRKGTGRAQNAACGVFSVSR